MTRGGRLVGAAAVAIAMAPIFSGDAVARERPTRGPVVAVAQGAELGAGPTAIVWARRVRAARGPARVCLRARIPYLSYGRRVVDDSLRCFVERRVRVMAYRPALGDCTTGVRLLLGVARTDVAAIELQRDPEASATRAKLVRDRRLSRSIQVFVAPVADRAEIRALDDAGTVLATSVFWSPYPGCPAPPGFGGLL